jgi:hypothetical protein
VRIPIADLYRVNLAQLGYLSWFKVEPELDPLRCEPRFKELLQSPFISLARRPQGMSGEEAINETDLIGQE